MKILKATTAAAAILISLWGTARAECLDDIKAAGVIKAGNGIMGAKPFVWQDEEGKYSGFEWEIFQEIGKRIGVAKQAYEITDWTSLIPGLKAGRWDIILSGMGATQERAQSAGISYSSPYFLLYDLVIVKKDSKIKTAEDLKSATVGSTLGTFDSINAHFLVEEGKAAKVLDFNDYSAPFLALRNGQVDAVVMDQATLFGQVETLNDLRTLGDRLPYRPKPEWADAEAKAPYKLGGLAIGVRKDCPALLSAINSAMDDMEKDGTRKRIIEKYKVWDEGQVKLMK
ncbi:ABC transporter substrate-binding protein [Pararhizobium sp. YC-54]|uniref:substrate-binding periplasmic protein n=1 Tax=Pararhizobium sp. YC-54 TaxID=2986920 RepID=UPI0021F73B0B|nr:ABC transporter substrate-binding protein [Pararhizobium sp. YC-54]MCW0002137.1 ABC transporter substrate-binding protein [Pararhizobium sp. YC-54]